MLEAIRKFDLRKCLKPDGPALVEGGRTGAMTLSYDFVGEVAVVEGLLQRHYSRRLKRGATPAAQ
jgi:hypothetical protein